MDHTYRNSLEDALLSKTIALPASASSSVNTDPIDCGAGIEKTRVEIEFSIPALSATIVPDTRTVTLTIVQSADPDFGSGNITLRSLVLTGADAAGVAATKVAARLTSNGGQYVRGSVAFGASTTDGSALSATLKALI